MVGIEPTLEKSNKILSLACLPVPPHSHEKPTMIIPKSDSVSKHVSTGSTGDWIRTNLIVIPFLCSEFVFSAYSYFGLNYHKPYWRYSLTFSQMLLHAVLIFNHRKSFIKHCITLYEKMTPAGIEPCISAVKGLSH